LSSGVGEDYYVYIPWTAKRTNASVWAEVGGGMSLEAKALKLKLSYFGHVIRGDGLEKDFMLGMGFMPKASMAR